MKDSIFSRMICVVLVLFYTGTMVPASTWKELGQSAKSTMDTYLDKAELSQSQSDWEMYVSTGFALACNVWENETGFEEEKSSIKEELNQSIEERYQKWLKKIINARLESNYSALKALLDKEEENYVLDGTDVLADKEKLEQWKSHAEGIIEEYLKTLDLNLDDFKGEMRQSYADSSINSLKKEMQNLAELSYTRLLVKLNATIKKNAILDAEEAAKAVLQDVVAEATDKINAQMDSLFSSLETQLQNPTDTDFDSDAFLEQFKSLYNQGLDSWAKAEQDFLNDRTDWENSANDTYNEACTVWTAALEELLTKKNAWKNKVEEQIQNLPAQIQAMQNAYDKQITEALTQYSASLETQKKTYLEYSTALVQNYQNLSDMLLTTQGCVDDWCILWGEKYNGIYSYWKTEDNSDTDAADLDENYIIQLLKEDGTLYFDPLNVNSSDITKITTAHDELIKEYFKKLTALYQTQKDEKIKKLENFLQSALSEFENFPKQYLDDYQKNNNINFEFNDITVDTLLKKEDSLGYFKSILQTLRDINADYWWDDEYSEYWGDYEENESRYAKLESDFTNYFNQYYDLNQYADFENQLKSLLAKGKESKDYTELEEYIQNVKQTTTLLNVKSFELLAGIFNSADSLAEWYKSAIELQKPIEDSLKQIKEFPYTLLGANSEKEYTMDSIADNLDLQILQINQKLEAIREEKEIAQAVADYAALPIDQRDNTEALQTKVSQAQNAYDAAQEEWNELKEGVKKEDGTVAVKGLSDYQSDIDEAKKNLQDAQTVLDAAKAALDKANLEYESQIYAQKLTNYKIILTAVKNNLINFTKELEEALASVRSNLNYYKNELYTVYEQIARDEHDEFVNSIESSDPDETGGEIESLFASQIESLNAELAKIDSSTQSDSFKKEWRRVIEVTLECVNNKIQDLKNQAIRGADGKNTDSYVYDELEWEKSVYCGDDDDYNEISPEFDNDKKFDEIVSFLNSIIGQINSIYRDNAQKYNKEGKKHTTSAIINELDSYRVSVGKVISNTKIEFDGSEESLEGFFNSIIKLQKNAFATFTEAPDKIKEVLSSAVNDYVDGWIQNVSYKYAEKLKAKDTALEQEHFTQKSEALKEEFPDLYEEDGTVKAELLNEDGEIKDEVLEDEGKAERLFLYTIKDSFFSNAGFYYFSDEIGWLEDLKTFGYEKLVTEKLCDASGKLSAENEALIDDYKKYTEGLEQKVKELFEAKKDSISELFTIKKSNLDKVQVSSGEPQNDLTALYAAAGELEKSNVTLDTYDAQNQEARRTELEGVVDDKQKAFEAAAITVKQKADEYKTACEQYNKHVELLNSKLENLNTLRLEHRKAAAIEAWASSIYLNDEVEDTENTYESPAEKLARLTKEEQIYQSYLSGLELASENAGGLTSEEKDALKELKTTDKELTELYAVYDILCEDFYTDYAELEQAGYKLQNAMSALVPKDAQNAQAAQEAQNALDWLSSFYENGAFTSDFETMLLATEYYLAEETDRKDELGLYAYDNMDTFNLNGSPDSKKGVNAKDKYLAKRKAVLKEAYEKYIQNAGGKENIEKCASYYGTGQLGYYLQRLTMFYLKNEALSKLSSELKGIINDETYFKWVSWIGLRPYVTDKGKAAEMYKTTVDALRKGNNELLTRDLTMLEMLMGEYSTAKKEYDTLAEAFEEKYYDGGKIAEGLSAEKAGEILDRVLNAESGSYGALIPETEADIAKYTDRVQIVMRPQEPAPEEQNDGTDGETEPTTGTEEPKNNIFESVVTAFEAILYQKEVALQNAKTAYINGQSEKVNDAYSQGHDYLEEALKNYATADLEAVKKEAESLWKATPDTQNFFEQWFNYYGSLLNFESLGKESALLGSAKVIHSIQNYLNAFNEILSEKNRAEYESYREELDKSRQVYANELSSLYQQTLEIERAGLIEWNKAYNKLQDKFTDFQNEFINRWNATTAKWQEAIEGFEADKADWINAMFMEAESRSLAGLESGSGQTSAGAALKAARDKVKALDDFDYTGIEMTSLVDSVLSESKISAIESLLNNKASSIEQTKSPAFMLKASDEYQLYQAAQNVAQIFEETNKRAEEISSRASAQRFKIEIDAKIKESIQKIEDKNTEMRSSFDERAFGEGYTVKNGYYRKKIVKDVSVFSVDTENVKVRMWKDFEANDPEVNLSLLEENVDAVSFSVIMTLVSAQLTDWENSIFGVSGVVSTGDDKASSKSVSYIVGEFEKYAYGEQYKGEVELGKGLVGKILLDFENNSQKEKAGWEALDAPTWERKLWCSDTFPGPSIREFSTMVASIAATVCTFGAGAVLAVAVSAAVMAANELTFELADVGVGYHDWDEAAKNVAKAAVSGAITGASGAAMGMASKVGGIGGVFLKTGITSSSSITTQFTNAFIDGGFSGVKDAFNSWSDWQGIAFSTAGSFVTNGLGAMNSFDSTGKLLNGNTFNTSAMSSFNSLAGGLTTNALEFAFTGQTTFNLANLSMLGLEYGSMWGAAGTGTISGGFLSMTIGENGTHFAISSAGTDISLGTLKLAAAGAKESSKVIDWKYGSVETNSTLNSINMLGYTNIGGNQKLSKDIWNEKISVNYTDTGGDYGNYSGGSTINISKTLLGGGAEDYAKLATVLAHEGTHAYGNRIEGEAHKTGLDTYTQINQAYDLSGDSAFVSEMIDAIMDKNSWKENTGDTDHWKIKMHADGTHELVDDKKKTLSIDYLDADGNVISTSKIEDERMNKMGWAESLVTVLGADRAEEILGVSNLESDIFLYDVQTLSDVLRISTELAEDLKYYNVDLENELALTEKQKKSLLGEALLKNSGASWDSESKVWVNTEGLKLTITDKSFYGNIMAEIQNGKYLYSSIAATLFRDPDSWNSVTSKDGKTWIANEENWNKDTILYQKTGLNWNYYDFCVVENYQTVDNLVSGSYAQPYQGYNLNCVLEKIWLQGNTVVSDFNLGYYTDGTENAGYQNSVLVTNNATTIDGTFIGKDGRDRPGALRWLEHDTSKWDVNKKDFVDLGTGKSDGCFITTIENQKELLQTLNSWNLSNGTQIGGSTINNMSYKYYLTHYPNTRGIR